MSTIQNDEKVNRLVRRTLPTASFSLKASQVLWISQSALAANKSKSAFVRDLLDTVIAQSRKEAA